jgi:hypothetical protein
MQQPPQRCHNHRLVLLSCCCSRRRRIFELLPQLPLQHGQLRSQKCIVLCQGAAAGAESAGSRLFSGQRRHQLLLGAHHTLQLAPQQLPLGHRCDACTQHWS